MEGCPYLGTVPHVLSLRLLDSYVERHGCMHRLEHISDTCHSFQKREKSRRHAHAADGRRQVGFCGTRLQQGYLL